MQGGVSHVETFDPKPALNKYAGMTIAETPTRTCSSPLVKKNVQVTDDRPKADDEDLPYAGRVPETRPKRH